MRLKLELVIFTFLLVTYVHSQCPDGWQSFTSAAKCFTVIQERVEYMEALQACQAQHGSLVSIHNIFQNTQIKQTPLNKTCEDDGIWIGLLDFGDPNVYTWADESPLDYTNWAPGYPDSGTGRVVYLSTMDSSAGKWFSTSLVTLNKCFACQQLQAPTTAITSTTDAVSGCVSDWFSFGSYCYKMMPDQVSWFDASMHCPQLADEEAKPYHPQLVSIHSIDEARAIARYLSNAEHWIGLSRATSDEDWAWSDGTDLDFENWDVDSQTTGNCVMAEYHGEWKESSCSTIRNYVCKYKKP